MASPVDIANIAATILGRPAIQSFNDNTNAARVLSLEYDLVRRGMLEGPGIWRFSVKRASLAAATGTPASGPFTTVFNLPADYIRALQVGDMYAGLDLSDYRQGPTDADYSVEGGQILCDYGAPLSLQYIYDCTDSGLFNPNFCIALGAHLAWLCCERLTNSLTKQQECEKRKSRAYAEAAATSAWVNPPGYTGDDSWILARMQ